MFIHIHYYFGNKNDSKISTQNLFIKYFINKYIQKTSLFYVDEIHNYDDIKLVYS
jgi:hypothetical protein